MSGLGGRVTQMLFEWDEGLSKEKAFFPVTSPLPALAVLCLSAETQQAPRAGFSAGPRRSEEGLPALSFARGPFLLLPHPPFFRPGFFFFYSLCFCHLCSSACQEMQLPLAPASSCFALEDSLLLLSPSPRLLTLIPKRFFSSRTCYKHIGRSIC